MRKKIMHIAEAAGGIDKFLRLFINNFDKSYDHILVLSQNYDESWFRKCQNVSFVEIVHMEHDLSFKDFLTIKKIKKLIKSFEPDVIYCHSTKAGFLGRLASKSKFNIVYNAHGWAFNMKCSKVKKFLYIKLEKFLAKKTKMIVCISKSEYNSAINNKICNEKKLICIYNGIDYSETIKAVAISKESIGFSRDSIIVGMIGRLCEQKGTDIFIKIAIKLIEYNKNYRFLLIGNGPMEGKIVSLIKEKNLEKFFHITGWVNNPLDYASAFNVACLLSRWEGFGYAIEEYKALNLPIVASNVDAIPELLDETFDLNDEEAIFNAIINKSDLFDVKYQKKFEIGNCTNKHKELFDVLCG